MTRLDDRARSAAASARRLADTVDPEQVLARIEGRAPRPRWFVPAVALGSLAAIAVVVVAVAGSLADDAPRIEDPGVVASPPDGSERPSTTTPPTSWELLSDPDFDQQPPTMLLSVESLADQLVAFGQHLEAAGEGATTAGANVWLSEDGSQWRRTVPEQLTGPGVDLVGTATGNGLVHVLVQTSDGPQVWTSADGASWDQTADLPPDLAADAADYRASALTVAPDGPVVVGVRTFGGDGASFTDTQPVAAVLTKAGWSVEPLGPQGRNVSVRAVTVVDGEPIAVGGVETPTTESWRGRVWHRAADGSWRTDEVATAPLDLVTPTETGWLAAASAFGGTQVVRGDRAGGMRPEVVDLDGVMLFDLVSVDGVAVGTGNTVISGPDDRPAVVRFGPDAGADVTWIADGGGLARGLTTVGTTVYVVGEATDRGEDGDGFVSRTAVWRGPTPGRSDAG